MVHPRCIGYTVIFADDAKKDLRRLEKNTIAKIFAKTEDLVSPESENLNIKKLKSKTPLYRVTVGDYRIIYCIKHEQIIVYVVVVGHRKDIYKNLDRRLGKNI